MEMEFETIRALGYDPIKIADQLAGAVKSEKDDVVEVKDEAEDDELGEVESPQKRRRAVATPVLAETNRMAWGTTVRSPGMTMTSFGAIAAQQLKLEQSSCSTSDDGVAQLPIDARSS